MRIFLHEDLEAEEKKQMERYLVAYDGDLAASEAEASHVLRPNGAFCPDWVRRSVQTGKREPLWIIPCFGTGSFLSRSFNIQNFSSCFCEVIMLFSRNWKTSLFCTRNDAMYKTKDKESIGRGRRSPIKKIESNDDSKRDENVFLF